MKTIAFSLAAATLALMVTNASARDRYVQQPPVVVSPDLSAPWVLQLQRQPVTAPRQRSRNQNLPAGVRVGISNAQPRRVIRQRRAPAAHRQRERGTVSALAPRPLPRKPAVREMNPAYLPQTVDFSGSEKAGTIIIDTNTKYLYYVQPGGKARRYGVGVGKQGFEWTGSERISQKRVWPDWRPPKEMIARERRKGRVLPAHMKGGPANPLGARALYLGSTLYRIHGTNQPWSIGQAVSSGCIRMRNEDVVALYEQVSVGAKVIVR